MPHSLGAFIRERRQDLGLSQEELANRVGGGMRQAEVSRLEHNRVLLPRKARLEQLASALQVTLGDLLVSTGWLNDDQAAGLNRAGSAGLDGVQEHHEDILGGIAETTEYIAEIKTMLDEMVQKLGEAERMMTDVLRMTANHGNNNGSVKPPAGIIRTWEHSATMRF